MMEGKVSEDPDYPDTAYAEYAGKHGSEGEAKATKG